MISEKTGMLQRTKVSPYRCSAFFGSHPNGPNFVPQILSEMNQVSAIWCALSFGHHTSFVLTCGQVGDGLNLKGKATDQLTLKAKTTRYQVGA
jgi:hypothetical protein